MEKIDNQQALPNPTVSSQDMALLTLAAKAVNGKLSQGHGVRRVSEGQEEWYGIPGIVLRDGIVRHPLANYAAACELLALMDLQLSFCRQAEQVTASSGPTPKGSFETAVPYQAFATKEEAACRAVVQLLASMGEKSA